VRGGFVAFFAIAICACAQRPTGSESDAALAEEPDASRTREPIAHAGERDLTQVDATQADATAPSDAKADDARLEVDAQVVVADAAGHAPARDADQSENAVPESDEEDAGNPGTETSAANGGSTAPVREPTEPPFPTVHDFFSTVTVHDRASIPPIGNGDLWPSCWSDDDALYSAAGDGWGFDVGPVVNDVVVARIDGGPTGSEPMRGTNLSASAQVSNIWGSELEYNRKPTGILCLGGDLYLAVQDLRLDTFSDAPAATIVRSSDKGQSWSWDTSGPMFSDHVFTTIMFLDFGKDSEHAPADYVYAYGLDDNWAFDVTTLPPPTELYLARIPRAKLQDRASWEFFVGLDSEAAPRWSPDIAMRAPVLEDTRRTYEKPLNPMQRFQNMTVINQGGVVYDAPLQRYIYTSWTEYTFEFYEAPQPWGPWKLFYSKDFGVTPWTMDRNGGYATTIPSKFISQDGTTLWLQANGWAQTGADNYNFSLREVSVTPYVPSDAVNERSPDTLSTPARGAVVFARALRAGKPQNLNDGVTNSQSEDSWTGDHKPEDYWGYTWPKTLHIDALRYTTGHKTSEGGWFEGLTVQVRRGAAWVPVSNVQIEPSYSHDANVADFTTFTLKFDPVTADGVRLIGKPGGSGTFTSIAELSAHFE
jgi:hypothetical protein